MCFLAARFWRRDFLAEDGLDIVNPLWFPAFYSDAYIVPDNVSADTLPGTLATVLAGGTAGNELSRMQNIPYAL